MSTIFTKIINREIPSSIVFEDESVLAFRDINPQAPVHILIIPKIEIPTSQDIDSVKHSELLGKLINAAQKIAVDEKIDKDGYRLVINCGQNGGQEVYHLHIHLLGGRKLNWPPG